MPPSPPPKEIRRRVLAAAEHGDVEALRTLLASGLLGPDDPHDALSLASGSGQLACMELLIPAHVSRGDHARPLGMAAQFGHPEAVRRLLPVSDLERGGSEAVDLAVAYGHLNVLDVLLPALGPKGYDTAFVRAAAHGNLAILTAMEPHASTKAFGAALVEAATRGFLTAVRRIEGFVDARHEARIQALSLARVLLQPEIAHAILERMPEEECRSLFARHTGTQSLRRQLDAFAPFVPVSDLVGVFTNQELSRMPQTRARLEAASMEAELPLPIRRPPVRF